MDNFTIERFRIAAYKMKAAMKYKKGQTVHIVTVCPFCIFEFLYFNEQSQH